MVIRYIKTFCFIILWWTAASCAAWSGGVPPVETSDPPAYGGVPPVETSEPPKYDDIPVYNKPVKNIAESDITITEVLIPQSVGYEHIELQYIIDENYALLTRSRGDRSAFWPPTNEIFYYIFTANLWEEPLSDEDIYVYPVCADADYCIGTTTTESMFYRSGTLVLLDKNRRALTTFFRYKQYENGLTGLHPNNIVIWNHHVYFDDFIFEATDATLYAYDIKNDQLRVFREHAMNPIIYKNEVWFFTPDEQGAFTLLRSESGGLIKNNHPIDALVGSQDKLFTIRGMGESPKWGASLTGVFEWDSKTAVVEFRGGNILYRLQGSRDFITWEMPLPHQLPCLYDTADEVIYEFMDYVYDAYHYTFYLSNQTGLLHIVELNEEQKKIGREKYLLFRKQ